MKKTICLLLSAVLALSVMGCGMRESTVPQGQPDVQAAAAITEWTRSGYFADENGNMLSVTWMDDVVDPGWFVGCMLGEDLVEDSYSGTLPLENGALRGTLTSGGSKGVLNVIVTEEGESGLQLVTGNGTVYHFDAFDMPTASIFVTVNIDGWGSIDYAEGEGTPEHDPEFPFQSAQINLGEPTTYTLAAWPDLGSRFVKWTRNGADYSTEPIITVLLDESADFVAVFEEDPDWVNPLEPYIGRYQCERARAEVELVGADTVSVTIEWGGSVSELARWNIFESADMDTMTIHYSNVVKSIVTYDSNGDVVSDVPEYEDGTGTIVFNEDGTFTWHEDQSDYGRDMVFEKLPNEEGNQ